MRALSLTASRCTLALVAAALTLSALPPAARAVGSAPVCDDTQQALRSGKPIELRVYCFDPEGDPMVITVSDAPGHGELTGDFTPDPASGDMKATFTPSGSSTGADAFTFTASDGAAESSPATFDLSITPNHAPECGPTSALHTKVDTPVTVSAVCEDEDVQDQSLTYVGVPGSGPAHGTLGDFGSDAQAEYSPSAGFTGEDSYAVRASDGSLSDDMTQAVHVANTPFCSSPSPVQVQPGSEQFLTVDCTVPSGDFGALEYTLGSGPSKGALSPPGATDSPGRTYRADGNAVGTDSYTVRLTSSSGSSSYVTQSISTGAVVSGTATPDPGPAAGSEVVPSPGPALGSPFSPGLPGPLAGLAAGARTIQDTRAPTVAVRVRAQRLRTVAAKGLALSASCDEPCVLRIRLRLDRATARKVKLGSGPLVVGARSRSQGAGATKVSVKLTARARRALRPARSVRVTIEARATDTAGNAAAPVVRRASLRR